MSMTEHKGWQIESRSYQGDANRWCPKALVSLFQGGGFCTHDVRALLSVTFATARDADDYAAKMAKTWIEDRDYRPLGCAPSDQGAGGHGAVRAMIVNAVLYLISLSFSLILKFGGFG